MATTSKPLNQTSARPTNGACRYSSAKASNSSTMPQSTEFIRLSAPIEHDNIVNGYGLRAIIWTQGCLQHCKGCQNPETWSLEEGIIVNIEDIKSELRALKGQSGLTFCGGEPFLQPLACKTIAEWAKKELGWNIWSFSGYTYEKIKQYGGDSLDFLNSLDALIDGPFILAERDLTMKFRGSRNQRLLHLKDGEIISVE